MTGFHDAFEAALDGDMAALWPHIEPGERTLGALAVYRNTVIKGRIDALEANYPTVTQLVGEDWLRAAAQVFIAEQPGTSPVMTDYGAGFADWLARFEPARDLPFLAPCARLDRAWTEAHLAPDADGLTPEQASAMGVGLAGRVLRLHPSTRLFWFDWTAPSLWLAHRYPEGPAGEDALVWRPEPEGLLIHRPGAEVRARRLDRAEWTFLDACRRGLLAGVAGHAAQVAQSGLDLSALFARLIRSGVFDSASVTGATA